MTDQPDAAEAESGPVLSYGVLIRDMEGVGPAGRVFGSPTKVGLKRLIDAGDARAVSDDEVEMARPYVITLEA